MALERAFAVITFSTTVKQEEPIGGANARMLTQTAPDYARYLRW